MLYFKRQSKISFHRGCLSAADAGQLSHMHPSHATMEEPAPPLWSLKYGKLGTRLKATDIHAQVEQRHIC